MQANSLPILQIETLVFDYPGCRALDNVSFQLEPGTITALVGANGAGKTTLMRCIAGLDTPLSGRVLMDGIHVADKPRQAHRLTGYLPDTFGLYKSLTVRQCLSYAALAQHIPASNLHQAVETVIDQMGLASYAKTQCAKLSRGWRQRVGIAQAIVHMPRLLILDEPASGLDPEARNDLALLFQKLQQKGMTILVSSHILSELDAYSTHMLIIREGKLFGFQAIHTDNESQKAVPKRQLHLALAKASPSFAGWLHAQAHVSVKSADDQTAIVFFAASLPEQATFLAAMIQQGFPLVSCAEHRENLQETYLASVQAYAQYQKERP